MFIGLDIGTSGVKAVLVDDHQSIVGEANAPLILQRPHPLWSEQNPSDWWNAVNSALAVLQKSKPREYAATRAIGLSGQMHGATLLDANNAVLRPAILWNDGRSGPQCVELLKNRPETPKITGNVPMPGFTAPKLLWVAEHEPEIFRQTARILLPKDYIRLRLMGEFASDMSDAAGTLWLDVANRCWSEPMLEACRLSVAQMPRLVEGSEATGTLRPDVAAELGLDQSVVVAGGAGDNAAGAVGVGAVEPGSAFLSLGTSGVYFLCNEEYRPNPSGGVHTFCHCLPGTWHQMSVILSAASCLSWIVKAVGAADVATLLSEIEHQPATGEIFLPYLSGERTPHNDPLASGVFFGLTHETNRAALGRAVLEGVAFAFADGQDALVATGSDIVGVSVIGGGANSPFWGRILASVLERPLTYHASGDVGPAFGAARLARLALTNETPKDICAPPPIERIMEPDPALHADLASRRERYVRLYSRLKDEFHMTERNG